MIIQITASKNISTTAYSLHRPTSCWCNYYSEWQKYHRNEQNVYTCPQL